MSIRTQYIGSEGAAFDRLSMVFGAMGYRKPQAEFDGAPGNYVQNIMNQYQADLSEDEVEAVIDFAHQSHADIRTSLSGLSPQAVERYVLGRR